jgi:N-acetylglucosaminyldiphosphoundecaprenol N-acetyl-beta-D-mannosaminyltransferase
VVTAATEAGEVGLTVPATLAAKLSQPARPGRASVLGVGVDPLTMAAAVAEIEGWIARAEIGYVTTCTVATVMQCQRSEDLREIVNRSSLVTPDGMPLVWLLRLAKNREAKQVCGPDLLPQLASRSAETGARHYFYGGRDGVADKLAENLTRRFPGLQVAGTFSPPFAPASELATEAVAATINATNPDIIWVGIGSPKQEHWMSAMRDLLTAPVLIGVGAAFDFHSGRVPRAPLWVRRIGFEWLYRLSREPRRLWRRYLLDNPAFVYLVARQLLRQRSYRLD